MPIECTIYGIMHRPCIDHAGAIFSSFYRLAIAPKFSRLSHLGLQDMPLNCLLDLACWDHVKAMFDLVLL